LYSPAHHAKKKKKTHECMNFKDAKLVFFIISIQIGSILIESTEFIGKLQGSFILIGCH
jgi:hypothetical protein